MHQKKSLKVDTSALCLAVTDVEYLVVVHFMLQRKQRQLVASRFLQALDRPRQATEFPNLKSGHYE